MEERENQSKFNAGIAKLMRIDDLKKRIHMARINNDHVTWLSCLEGWREELSERIDEQQAKKCDAYEKNIQQVLGDKGAAPVILRLLKEYGIYLTKKEYDFGLGMPDMDDDEGL